MTHDQLKEGQELLHLIEATEEAIKNLKGIEPAKRDYERKYDDGLYWLAISEQRDGSGKRADLRRYYGNERLLKVITDELERQLSEFKAAFQTL
ncbi:hypothetical protein [Brevibacillus brevis]|uniref:hypothetical protein n=1 Tax=Brevibacillus brevis TaxID=1393 RepID=UPI0007D8A799|nr:hypothetical protein [Brevibacillus brevis]